MATSNKAIFTTFVLLIASVLFFAYTNIDTTIQDMFFNFQTKTWLLNHDAQPYRFIFYTGAKKLLIFVGVVLFITLFFYKKSRLVAKYKKGLMVVIASAVIVPYTVNVLKSNTGMPCPKEEIRYGWLFPPKKVWEKPTQISRMIGVPHCWPAGHASGGFALMSLFFLFKSKRNRYIGLATGLGFGWITGAYKMIIGDHFFSHTWITMVLAWFIIIIIARILGVEKELHHG